ncbi:unnamed protein product, partial [Protopolystoma xenopodis]
HLLKETLNHHECPGPKPFDPRLLNSTSCDLHHHPALSESTSRCLTVPEGQTEQQALPLMTLSDPLVNSYPGISTPLSVANTIFSRLPLVDSDANCPVSVSSATTESHAEHTEDESSNPSNLPARNYDKSLNGCTKSPKTILISNATHHAPFLPGTDVLIKRGTRLGVPRRLIAGHDNATAADLPRSSLLFQDSLLSSSVMFNSEEVSMGLVK